MVQVGAMYSQLAMEDASFRSGMANAQKQLNRLAYESRKTGQQVSQSMNGIEASVAGMTRSLKASAGAFVGAFAIGSLSNIVAEGLAYASSLGEVAQQLGVTTDTLQEYRYVATQVGIEQADMDAALGKLTRTIGDADMGAKSQAEAFRVLGIATRDANGNLRTTDQILPELIAAFSKIPDPAARAALQVDIFGKSGQKLDTLLSAGVEQVNNLRNAAHELGVVLSPDLIARADDAADKLGAISTVLKVQLAGIVAQNAQAILDLAGAFATAANAAGKFFSTMRGVERIQKYEGWATGFFSSMGEQDMASTEKGYAQRLLQQNLNLRNRVIQARNNYNADPSESRRRGVMRLVDELNQHTQLLRRYDRDLQAAKAGAQQSLATTTNDDANRKDPLAGLRASGGRGSRRNGGGGGARPKEDVLGRELQSLLERIKPEDLKVLDQFIADQATLDAAFKRNKISADDYAVAMERLTAAFTEARYGKPGPSVEQVDTVALEEWASTFRMSEIAQAAEESWDRIRDKNSELAESFMVMSQRINSDLRSLVDGIKGGDIFDLLDGVLGLSGSLSGTGVFGAGLKKRFENAPSWALAGFRADGGPVSSGRAYIVGERGPELFIPKSSGMVLPDLATTGISRVSVGTGQSGRPVGEWSPPPIVIEMVSEEGPALVPRMRATSADVTMKYGSSIAKRQVRAGRARLA